MLKEHEIPGREVKMSITVRRGAYGTMAARIVEGRDWKNEASVGAPRILLGPFEREEGADETSEQPFEVHVYPDGSAVACHPVLGNTAYGTLVALATEYEILLTHVVFP
jgi:hypothetical protein